MTVETRRWFVYRYVERDVDGSYPCSFPRQVRRCTDLSPATVVIAGFDPLRDEAVTYADRLAVAGVPVHRHDFDDVVHEFFGLLRDQAVDRARAAVRAVESAFADTHE